jgi:nucleoside-diphosphate-sugar epimerase
MSVAPLHVVFGAGQVGMQLAEFLSGRGFRVRVVRRSARPVDSRIEVVSGDAQDPAFAARATEGAAAIYHCMNPSQYTAKVWEQEFPRQGEALIHAAVTNGARLVVLDNLYGYGETEERRTESTPMRAGGRKGKVRVAWAERLERAGREQGLRFVVGRAGDFFGPGASQAAISTEGLRKMVAGSPLWLPGNPSASHAFSFVPDVAEGLASLGTAEADVDGQVFHLPVIEVSPAELVGAIARSAGIAPKFKAAGRTFFRLLSPFASFFREVLETLYQWERPFLVDDTRFRRRFPNVGTALETAARLTAEDPAAATR